MQNAIQGSLQKFTQATKPLSSIRGLSVLAMGAKLGIGASLLILAGCATTGNITPQYVAPSNYQGYDCSGLAQEYNRIGKYIEQTKSQSSSSITTTGVGVGISAGRWGISPNISIGLGKGGNNQAKKTKLAQLLGEQDAVVQSARMKQCPFAANLKTYGEK